MTQEDTILNILVAGAGGFIGHHLVARLTAEGHQVRGVDSKRPEFAPSPAAEFLIADLRDYDSCRQAVADMDDVYQLAADMGGIGYITANLATLSRNNILINSNMLEAARLAGVRRYLYSSSACVYPIFRQQEACLVPSIATASSSLVIKNAKEPFIFLPVAVENKRSQAVTIAAILPFMSAAPRPCK